MFLPYNSLFRILIWEFYDFHPRGSSIKLSQYSREGWSIKVEVFPKPSERKVQINLCNGILNRSKDSKSLLAAQQRNSRIADLKASEAKTQLEGKQRQEYWSDPGEVKVPQRLWQSTQYNE